MSALEKALGQLDEMTSQNVKSRETLRKEAICAICRDADTSIAAPEELDSKGKLNPKKLAADAKVLTSAIGDGVISRTEVERFREVAAEVAQLKPLVDGAHERAKQYAEIVDREMKRRKELSDELQACIRTINQAETDRGGAHDLQMRLREIGEQFPEVAEAMLGTTEPKPKAEPSEPQVYADSWPKPEDDERLVPSKVNPEQATGDQSSDVF